MEKKRVLMNLYGKKDFRLNNKQPPKMYWYDPEEMNI